MSCLVLLLCLPAAAAYTLLGAHSGRSLRTVGCFAAEKGPSGGNALEGPQGGGPAISARALDQLIQADPEKKKAWKGFKRGKKQSERKTEQKSAPSGKGFGGAQTARFDRRPAKGVACACGSAQSYEACCQPCHEAGLATEPLALIRARYTAYAYRLPDFLIDTTSPDHEEWETDRTAWKKDLLTFCDTFVCEGLEVGQQQAGDAAAVGGADAVQVPFRAKLVQKGAIKMLDLLETSTPARSYKIGAMAVAKDLKTNVQEPWRSRQETSILFSCRGLGSNHAPQPQAAQLLCAVPAEQAAGARRSERAECRRRTRCHCRHCGTRAHCVANKRRTAMAAHCTCTRPWAYTRVLLV